MGRDGLGAGVCAKPEQPQVRFCRGNTIYAAWVALLSFFRSCCIITWAAGQGWSGAEPCAAECSCAVQVVAGIRARAASARAAGARALQPAPPVQEQAGTPVGRRAPGARVPVGAELLGLLEGPGTGEGNSGQRRVGGPTAGASALQLAPPVREQAGTPAGVHAPGAGSALGADLLVQEGPGTGSGEPGQSKVQGPAAVHQGQEASGNGQPKKGKGVKVALLSDTYMDLIVWFPLLWLLPMCVAGCYMSCSVAGPAGSEYELNFRDPFVCLSVLIGAVWILYWCCVPVLLIVLACIG